MGLGASASAPTALTVQVNQRSGKDPLAERLARPLIHQEKSPMLAGAAPHQLAYGPQATALLVQRRQHHALFGLQLCVS